LEKKRSEGKKWKRYKEKESKKVAFRFFPLVALCLTPLFILDCESNHCIENKEPTIE